MTGVRAYFIITYRKVGFETILRVRMRGKYPSSESLASIFSVGLPAAASVFLFDLCNIVINRLSSSYGDTQAGRLAGRYIKEGIYIRQNEFGAAPKRNRADYLYHC